MVFALAGDSTITRHFPLAAVISQSQEGGSSWKRRKAGHASQPVLVHPQTGREAYCPPRKVSSRSKPAGRRRLALPAGFGYDAASPRNPAGIALLLQKRQAGLKVMECLLAIDRALFQVRLGCYAEERAQPRDVELDLRIWFREPPRGCSTDRLEDVVCYAELVEAVEQVVAGREFHLIERLAVVTYDTLKPLIPDTARLWVRLRKVHPPIDALKQGVSFSYGECHPGP